MEPLQLKAGSASGGQQQGVSKSNLAQPATGSNAGGTPIGSVQPGVAASSLTSQSGISLGGQGALPGVSLGPPTSTISQPVKTTPPKHHHVGAILFGLPVLLVVIAVIGSWWAARAEKSTTGYR